MASFTRSMARRAVAEFTAANWHRRGLGLKQTIAPWRLRNGKPKKKARKAA